jgi:hypothetical protein
MCCCGFIIILVLVNAIVYRNSKFISLGIDVYGSFALSRMMVNEVKRLSPEGAYCPVRVVLTTFKTATSTKRE